MRNRSDIPHRGDCRTEGDVRAILGEASKFKAEHPELLELVKENGDIRAVHPELCRKLDHLKHAVNAGAKDLIEQQGRTPDILLETTAFLEWAGLVMHGEEFYTYYTPLDGPYGIGPPIRGNKEDPRITGYIAMRSELVRKKLTNTGIIETTPLATNDILHLIFETTKQIDWAQNGQWMMPNFTNKELGKLAEENDRSPGRGKIAEGLVRRVERCYEAVRACANENGFDGNHLTLITERHKVRGERVGDLSFRFKKGKSITFPPFAATGVPNSTEGAEISWKIQQELARAKKQIWETVRGEIAGKGKGFNKKALKGGQKPFNPSLIYRS